MVKLTPRLGTVEVTADGDGLVSHAGVALLVELADRCGLTGALSGALAESRERRSAHDPGRVLRDVAVMLADGGDCVTDMDAYRGQERLFGARASETTTHRVLKSIDGALLGRVRSARAEARARVWDAGARPDTITLNIDRADGTDPLGRLLARPAVHADRDRRRFARGHPRGWRPRRTRRSPARRRLHLSHPEPALRPEHLGSVAGRGVRLRAHRRRHPQCAARPPGTGGTGGMSAMESTPQEIIPDGDRSTLRDALARLGREVPVVQLVVLIGMFIFGAVTLQGFSSLVSVKSMLLLSAFLGLAALGQTVLVLMGHLDLSVPGFIGFGNVVTAILYGQDHWSFEATLLLILVVAIVMGSVSGVICHRLRVQSIVVTLGMNFVMLGVIGIMAANGITGSGPAWLTRFATVTSPTLGVSVPPLVVLWVVVALVAAFVLRRTRAGRRVDLTGANPRAAELALVRTGRVVVAAFALSALSAAVTGVLLTGFSGSGDTSIGTPYLFTSLTAVIVGGTSIAGARGDYWHTVIGAIMLTVINTVLLAKGYSNAEQQILFGVIILVAVLAYGRETRLRDRV